MKKILLGMIMVLIVTIFSTTISAQDILYLKNGSILKGSVLEQTPDKDLKFQTRDGSIYVYQMSEVEKITKESVANQKSNDIQSGLQSGLVSVDKEADLNPAINGRNGFHFGFDLAYGFGFGQAKHIMQFLISLNTGYQFNRILYAGIGVAPALNWYSASGYSNTSFIMPIYGTLRASFNIEKLGNGYVPFIESRNGYALSFEDGSSGCYYNREMIGMLDRTGYFGITYTYMNGHYIGVTWGMEF